MSLYIEFQKEKVLQEDLIATIVKKNFFGLTLFPYFLFYFFGVSADSAKKG